MSKRSHKTVGSRFFLLFLLDDRRMIEGSGSIPLTNGSGSGRPNKIGSGTLNQTQFYNYFVTFSFPLPVPTFVKNA
jgi:hypothetical protein